MLPDDLSIEPLAFALPRGDSSFRLEVNRALTQVYVGGEIEAIFNQWLGALGRPSRTARRDVPAQRDPAIAAPRRQGTEAGIIAAGAALAAPLVARVRGSLSPALSIPGELPC